MGSLDFAYYRYSVEIYSTFFATGTTHRYTFLYFVSFLDNTVNYGDAVVSASLGSHLGRVCD